VMVAAVMVAAVMVAAVMVAAGMVAAVTVAAVTVAAVTAVAVTAAVMVAAVTAAVMVAAVTVGNANRYALPRNMDRIFTGNGKILTVRRYSRELRAQYSLLVLRPANTGRCLGEL
ncbi:MAG: hypothetical protein ACLQJ7_16260, partial [Syntrophobacteraceae bacterium]